jgi:DNA-binding HxlR family transcriptional regulator
MARTKEYPHYCPVALTLETVGEKWSLLIVRDLLFGPQRFTDLLGSLGGITPKWLTLRLRELEASGVVERDQVSGRREVWYQLTPKGQDLMPVIEALVGWGLHYTRPPQPGDVVHPWRAVALAAFIFNQSGMRLTHPRTWVVRFAADQAHALHFDGERWTYQRDAVGDVAIETKPKAWLAFLAAAPGERARLLPDLHITGKPAPVAEFETAFTSDHA